MYAKIISIFLILGAVLLVPSISAKTTLTTADTQVITKNINLLTQYINSGNSKQISSLVSSSNATLSADIQNGIKGCSTIKFNFAPIDKNSQVLSENQVKIKGSFSASGMNWETNGIPTYFTLQKENNTWLIIDTDFHKKLGADYIFALIGKIFLIIGPIALLMVLFWLWMLIDCIQNDFSDKTIWILLLVFLNFIAAILYYFMIKRKNQAKKVI